MGFSKYQRKEVEKPGPNPVWRGIGCILMVVVPVAAYLLTMYIVPWLLSTGLVPEELLQSIKFPAWMYTTPTLGSIVIYLSNIENPWVKLIVFFILFILLTSIFSLLYSAVAQVVGPPRYLEVDAPPSKHKAKVYKR